MTSRIVLPSAKLVPEELQKIGKLPAIIYPVNGKIVFEYLYNQYKAVSSDFHVMVYENAEEVRSKLAGYPAEQVHIDELDELGDLSLTIEKGLEDYTGEAVINFADTIVLDPVTQLRGDVLYYTRDYMNETWTYFEERNGVITGITDKKDIKESRKGNLFVGVFSVSDAVTLSRCLREADEASKEGPLSMSKFYYALMLYSRIHPFMFVETGNWFDIGHAENYYQTELEVRSRAFNTITIDKERGMLRKTSEHVEKFIGEIKWYLKLPTDIEYARPRIFDYSTNYVDPYITMEYYSYHTLHELYLYGNLTEQQWTDIFERIRFVCCDMKRYTVSDSKIQPALKDMYLDKTLVRITELRNQENFKHFFEAPIRVNNRLYPSLQDVAIEIQKVIPEKLFDVTTFNIIHGDLCFANIMIDSNFSFIKVIDPRGKFGSFDIYGDFRYELAKLVHSIDGKYDYIIKDLFFIDYDIEDNRINYRTFARKGDQNLFDIFKRVFRDEIGEDLEKIELIESLLFLSMISLHHESVDHQMAMLATGLTILDRTCHFSKPLKG